jgi:catechol 2,3-dioxygenase-like lactoylglutathione lyase family enzyme
MFERLALLPLRMALLLLAALWCGVCSATPVSTLDSVAVTVSDLQRATDFYEKVLTFQKVSEREVSGNDLAGRYGAEIFAQGASAGSIRVKIVRLRLGDEALELMQFRSPARGRPMPADSRGNDRWFQHVAIIVSDMDAAYARLRSFKVEHASSYPQRLPDSNPNAGGIQAFYFRDPDGHFLEILSFPKDKGAPRWHQAHEGKLFLGIDHTAIVVTDTEQSLRFYRDRLGMTVAGTSENFGFEQEHLNNVFGAHLLITGLRAPQGPGVEFLEYLAPRDGRPMPADTKPNDIWFWQINFRADASSMLLHDPDGHASLLMGAP